MSTHEPSLRVRLNQIDHTLAKPGVLDNSTLHRVPVIRIYGESSTGSKACVHIHQVYPYFFVEYTGNINPDSVTAYIARLTHSLNHAIAISMKRNPHSPKSQFVRAILLVKGVPFYGFHAAYSPFLKVHIADPAFLNRAVTIMQSGTVMKTRFRVYESHLSYLLQFLCDFGLYGCGWLDLGDVWERGGGAPDDIQQPWQSQHEDALFKPSPHFRQSRMPLEVDVAAHQILNRHLLTARNLHHKLSIPAPPLPPEPLVLSVRELWEDERRRRLAKGLSPSPEIPKDPSENSRGPGGAWVSEVRYWDEVRKRIERERGKEKVLSSGKGWEKWVMTTFESVEALWEDEWKVWRPQRSGDDVTDKPVADEPKEDNPYEISIISQLWSQGSGGAAGEIEVEVDEDLLSSQAMNQLVEREEAEWEKLVGGNREREDDVHEDEDATEDGPPPEMQSDELEVGNESPSDQPPADTPSKRNPFQDAWNRLVRPSMHRPTSTVSNGQARTPTRSRISAATLHSKTPARRSPRLHRTEGAAGMISSTQPVPPAFSNRSPPAIPTEPTTPSSWFPTVPASHMLLKEQTRRKDIADKILGDQSNQFDMHDGPSRTASALDDPQPALPPNSAAPLDADFFDPENPFLPESLSKKRMASQTSGSASDEGSRPAKKQRLTFTPNQDINVVPSDPGKRILSLPSSGKTATRLSHPIRRPLTSSSGAKTSSYVYVPLPPSASELLGSVDAHGILNKIYTDPYYSKESDAPERPREYAGLVFNLKGGEGLDILDEWVDDATLGRGKGKSKVPSTTIDPAGVGGWEYAGSPPSVRQVRQWLTEQNSQHGTANVTAKRPSQIEGPTQANPYGLKNTPAQRAGSANRERRNMSVFALEIFAPAQGDRLPDPGADEVVALFYSFQDSAIHSTDSDGHFFCDSGLIVVENAPLDPRRLRDVQLEVVSTELDLLNKIIDVVNDLDPDVLVGWEVQATSWGYLSARASTYGLDIGDQISRAPGRHVGGGTDQWGMRTTSTFKVTGRHVLNLWRVMRAEHSFTIYTFEHVVFQILRRRTPRYSPRTLTEWYISSIPSHTARVLHYFSSRTSMVLEILDVAEVVTKNAEFARVFGVDFFSVLSRGSQFKVESFMFRIAKPESFVLLSPSKQDVGKQNAAECMPLIMEPLSAFYNSPLVVLDFQSLYPSIMIAYNYCYSTCLGRVTDFKGQNKFGVTDLHRPAGLLDTLHEHINIAPNGMMYVKPDVRRGLLGRMLTELLDTRVMVKQAMKGVKDDKALRRVLDARQLGLKFIANVTYGYTSATYSGRMPAVEIADSIVQSGRETLEKAIRIIDSTKKWGAKVVYGDTDSVFIYLRGKTKEQAFRIGHDMADTITALNPAPVKLKFEKVYLPCVLMAKKRYVGFKFESPDDTEPVFDAKGIETVRRDGVPAQAKMTETCLKILFRTQDLSKVKEYCCTSWARILENRVSIQDFIFAKEVRMGTYSERVPPPPGVTVAARRMVDDPNAEPQYGERIPYVIVRGPPNSRLVDRAVAPEELLNNSQKHLDAAYYISRVLIPPLERVFNLVGADVRAWYDDMPRALRADQPDAVMLSPRKDKAAAPAGAIKIDEHFLSSHCVLCGALTPDGLCDACRLDPQVSLSGLLARVRIAEDRLKDVQTVCGTCCAAAPAEPVKCESLDCPWLFERKKAENKAEALVAIHGLIEELEAAEEEQAETSSEYEISDND